MNKIKDVLKYILKNSYRQQIKNIVNTSEFHLEKKESDKAPNLLLIQRINENVGTYSDYIVFLAYIEHAVRNNMLPVIDRMTIKNFFLSGKSMDNTWEFFFEQPMGISLQEATQGGYNIYRAYTADINAISLINCHEEMTIQYWRAFAKKYIRLNQETMSHVKAYEDKILAGKRVLGIALREGYKVCFNNTHIGRNHAFQMDADNMIPIAKEKMLEWNCDSVFLTCQADESVAKFRESFGDKLIIYERKRGIVDGKPAHSQRTQEEERKNELDYITEMNLLSKCCCLLCSQNSGTEAAFIMSDGFEHFECIDIGKKK